MSSRKPRSSERVPRTLTDGTLAEREQNITDREQISNRYGTGMEGGQNGNGNACGTATERVLSSVPC